MDEDGYVYVMGRTDDIINVAGHRLSTGGMEEVLASHPDVAECAVIGVADALKGEVPLRLRRAEGRRQPARRRDRAGDASRWCARRSARSPPSSWRSRSTRLPKTRSGKILRGTMKKIADGETWTHAGDHRRSGDPRRDRRRAEGQGARQARVTPVSRGRSLQSAIPASWTILPQRAISLATNSLHAVRRRRDLHQRAVARQHVHDRWIVHDLADVAGELVDDRLRYVRGRRDGMPRRACRSQECRPRPTAGYRAPPARAAPS